MDKISGILPASARVRGPVEAPAPVAAETAVPTRSVQAPVAAKAEDAAQPQDRVTLSKLAEKSREMGEAPAPEAEPPKTYKPSPQSAKLKAIDDLNSKFFSNPKTLARGDTDMTSSEEALKSMEDVHGLAMGPQAQPGSHGLRAS